MQDTINLQTVFAFLWKRKLLFIVLFVIYFGLCFGYQFHRFKGLKIEKKYFIKNELTYVNYAHLLSLRLLFLKDPNLVAETRLKLEEQNIKLTNGQISEIISIKLQEIGNMPGPNNKYVNAYIMNFSVQHPDNNVAETVLKAWTEVCHERYDKELENLKIYSEKIKAEELNFQEKDSRVDAQIQNILHSFNAPTIANLKERAITTIAQNDKLIKQLINAELQLKTLSMNYPQQVLDNAQVTIELARNLLNYQTENPLIRNFKQNSKLSIGKNLDTLKTDFNSEFEGLFNTVNEIGVKFDRSISYLKNFLQHTKTELQNAIAQLDTLQTEKNEITQSKKTLSKEMDLLQPKIFTFEISDGPKVIFSKKNFLLSSTILSLVSSLLLSFLSIFAISAIAQQYDRL